jgi:hypothetical protein
MKLHAVSWQKTIQESALGKFMASELKPVLFLLLLVTEDRKANNFSLNP